MLTIPQAIQQAIQQQQSGHLDQAAVICRQVLQVEPTHPEALHLLGIMSAQKGDFDTAISLIRQAIANKPTESSFHNNLGNILKLGGQIEEAIIHYQQSLNLNPHNAHTYNNLGVLYQEQEEFSKAIACFKQAFKLAPQYAEAYNNLAVSFKSQGRLGEALVYFEKSLSIQSSPHIHSSYLHTFNFLPKDDPKRLFNEHLRFDRLYGAALNRSSLFSKFSSRRQDVTKKLKIGYVSADFRQHSVAYFMKAILAHHCHEHFEIICFYNNAINDQMTQQLRSYADQWIVCAGLSDEQLAEYIRQQEVDILVDLMGHTITNRLLVFARKPAPVQVTYLGYPTTTGLSAIDYRLTDKYVDPQEDKQSLATERPVYLPDSYFCYCPDENAPDVNELPALTTGYITFGSFNNFIKLNSSLLQLWAKILKQVPNSRLMVKPNSNVFNDVDMRQGFLKHFTRLGISPERLILLNRLPTIQSHLESYQQVDIALDSYPYNGATTTCEALWMGIPVVTLVGRIHAARVGLSLLSTMGLPELIAYKPAEYIEIAVYLANNLVRLQTLRSQQREKMRASPLMNSERFTHHLELIYHNLWQTGCNAAS